MPTATKTSAKSAAAKKTAAPKNAIQLLTEDHREVKGLFEQYKKLAEGDAEGGKRQALAQTICAMLTIHTTIEEEIFYPAAREALDDDEGEDLLDEAEVEHASAKDLIAQISDMEPDDDLYDAKVKVLGEYVDHHVQEEEREMFPKAKKSDMDLKELGIQLQDRKTELMAELGDSAEE
jgi:hemerythrin superfamily protein